MNLSPCELWFKPSKPGSRWVKLMSGTYSDCVARGVLGGDDKFPSYWIKELATEAAEAERYTATLFDMEPAA